MTLTSGATSRFYFDMKPTTFDGEGATIIGDMLLDAIESREVDYVAGLEMGALPVVIGWAAGGPLTAGAWTLFAIVFVWQLPHFLALTWLYRIDFERAGLPLLSVTDPSGRRTARHLLVYTILLVPVSIAPSWLGLAGLGYAAGATILTFALLFLATRFAADRSTDRARVLFRATLLYLPLIWGLLLLDAAG